MEYQKVYIPPSQMAQRTSPTSTISYRKPPTIESKDTPYYTPPPIENKAQGETIKAQDEPPKPQEENNKAPQVRGSYEPRGSNEQRSSQEEKREGDSPAPTLKSPSKPQVSKPQSTFSITLLGYLMKRNPGGPVKTWKKRYFTVKKKPAKDGNGDKEEWILEYKETESATLPINAIPLETTTEFKERPQLDPYAFGVEIPGREYILKAPNELEFQRWKKGLQLVLEHVKNIHKNQVDPNVDIIFEEQNSDQVKAATLEKLIERLTDEKVADPQFTNIFLLTYRSFTDGSTLLRHLILRYKFSREQIKDPLRAQVIRLKIYNVIKIWIDKYGYEFVESQRLYKAIQGFINQMKQELKNESQHLSEMLTKLMDESQRLGYTKSSMLNSFYLLEKKLSAKPKTPAILPPDFDTMDESMFVLKVDSLELARQITLVEFAYFHAIQPKECLDQNWNKAKKASKSPSIFHLINHFNKVSKWVASEILRTEDLTKRTQLICKFIYIAEKCKEMNNFNALMEVVSGLEVTPVYRLRKTWAGVPDSLKKSFEELKEIMNQTNNYKKYRAALRSATLPCLPYLGVYLTDLVFIDEGNPNTMGHLIFFSKRKQVSNVINEIQQYQQSPFYFETVPRLYKWIRNMRPIEDEDEMYEMSLLREPRESRGSNRS